MSIKQFKFVSPGVFINEIDNSFLPDAPDKVGPVIIGRTERGPAMEPYKINSFSEFINVFGNPIPGGSGNDVWRYGNYTAPTYAGYAAMAYLRNSGPVTIVRLAGAENPGAVESGYAGWKTDNQYDVGGDEGGAYGLWICPSGSTVAANSNVTGTLAATWYCDTGYIALSGTIASGSTAGAGVGVAIMSIGGTYGFKGRVNNGSGYVLDTEFNFNVASDKFIRKVFNTNPTLTNDSLSTTATATSSYWLGQTYENWLGNTTAGHDVTGSGASYWGVILPMIAFNTRSCDVANQQVQLTTAQTDWIFSQDIADGPEATASYGYDNMQNLFKIHALNSGLWEGQRFKVAIQDIRYSTTDVNPYGSFSVVVRNVKDSDSAIQYLERFTQCNLNPRSPNYIARKIGDTYSVWNDEEGRYIEYGSYANRSKYMRIEMNEQVDGAFTNETYLPYGYRGPTKFADWAYFSGSFTGSFSPTVPGTGTPAPVSGSESIGGGTAIMVSGSPEATTASFIFPAILPRDTSLTAPSPTKAYWGATAQVNNSPTLFDYNWYDYVRAMNRGVVGGQHSELTTPANTALTRSFVFTLDDLSASVNYAGGPAVSASAQVNLMRWAQGSRGGGLSYRGTGSYKEIIKRGFDQFVVPLYGGTDGVDIHEMNPFRNSKMASVGLVNETTSYEFNSIKRAIESVSDPEVVDCNIITMPGLTLPGLNTRLLRACESRADSLGIIDLPGGYQPIAEAPGTEQTRMGSLNDVIQSLQDQQENTSYGCAYYPWIQIRDPENKAMFWAPPSIAALGVMANTEKQAELWFAPAGFNRGGLTVGAAGLPVTNVRTKLSSKERDNLYEAKINPIASFPNEGIVVFGQKTLQMEASALDRINVRRLMNYIKKEVSRMAATILFDQNVPSTWNRFISRVDPFLSTVKARFGLQDYKVVLDTTTTTPELIDRNIMYAKIFLKPTRAIEFIAIDFNISNSGAAFAD